MRGRPRKADNADAQTIQAREANRRAHAKKTGKPIPAKANQFGDFEKIGNVKWSELKEKWKDFEGQRLEKSIIKPVFLTQGIRRAYQEKAEAAG